MRPPWVNSSSSWDNIGKALTLAGIKFKTGNPWGGENLRRSVALALKPRKGRGRPAANAAVVMETTLTAVFMSPRAGAARVTAKTAVTLPLKGRGKNEQT
jgi:hypothetical protein